MRLNPYLMRLPAKFCSTGLVLFALVCLGGCAENDNPAPSAQLVDVTLGETVQQTLAKTSGVDTSVIEMTDDGEQGLMVTIPQGSRMNVPGQIGALVVAVVCEVPDHVTMIAVPEELIDQIEGSPPITERLERLISEHC